MKVAEQIGVCVPFFERVRRRSFAHPHARLRWTLAPFTMDRMRAFPYRGIPELISKVMRTDTRVVFISGRSARELLFLSGIHPPPEIWGATARKGYLPTHVTRSIRLG